MNDKLSQNGSTKKGSFSDDGIMANFEGGKPIDRSEDNDPQPTTGKEILKKWPKATFAIVGNEFCERFSYYGMRAVLTLYLINILNYSDDDSTVLFHAFTVVSYTAPLAGSILADGYIGKFWTIFFVSIFYACGNVILAVASTFGKEASVHPWMDFLGLFIIGLGTGGIKPCVSSFGADQFPAHYVVMISYFFSVFYFCINFGSTISMLLTPIMRTTPCLGHDSCYPLAFGIPAGLMIISTIVFVLGSPFYLRLPPKDNVIKRVFCAICKAIYNFFRNWGIKREHWMDHYLDGHSCENDGKCRALAVKGKRIGEKCQKKKFADDVKSLVRVAVMMSPMPMFWALYDQQSSRWVIQSVEMDSEIWPGFHMLPDQMQVFNAVLILIFIPIFQGIIYPLIEKCGIRVTALRKMVVGGFLAALAFGVTGLVQLRVNQTLPDVPAQNEAYVTIINTFPLCNVNVTTSGINHYVAANSSLIDDKVKNKLHLYRFKVGGGKEMSFDFVYSGQGCPQTLTETVNFYFKGGSTDFVGTGPQGYFTSTSSTVKPKGGLGESSVSLNLLLPCSSINLTTVWWDKGCNETESPNSIAYTSRIAACEYNEKNPECDPRNKGYFVWKEKNGKGDSAVHAMAVTSGTGQSNLTASKYDPANVKPGVYQMFYVHYLKADTDRTPEKSDLLVSQIEGVFLEITGQGGVYTLTLSHLANSNFYTHFQQAHSGAEEPREHPVAGSSVHYHHGGEILFSLTGLEFSYDQAAPSLKSVVSALFLLTTAFGDLIVIIIDKAVKIENLATIMFVFAAAMVVVISVFVLMSIFYYDYVDYSTKQSDEDDEDKRLEGHENFSFETQEDEVSRL
ncbi:hypothetical protein L596_005370 [Steinernema carpocapsae]|uniref:Oligopeptide transporter 1 n=1 Tax=Steinernema carpocapsae TaxID=34508 RepID=A0A4U8V3D0_STECR|nr:hypothetical protein L596_005370 [Steinernema carpocapsae]